MVRIILKLLAWIATTIVSFCIGIIFAGAVLVTDQKTYEAVAEILKG